MAKMHLRMCASSASAPAGDVKAADGRDVREEGGAQGNWASEEGLRHSKKVGERAKSAAPAGAHRDGVHAQTMLHASHRVFSCSRRPKTMGSLRSHNQQPQSRCLHVERNPRYAPESRQRSRLWPHSVGSSISSMLPSHCHHHQPQSRVIITCT